MIEEIHPIFAEELDKCFDGEWQATSTKYLKTQLWRRTRKPASLAGLQHQVQQSRLATETDAKTAKKTRKRTEGAAAYGVKNEDNSSARLDDGPTSLTSFGNIAEPPAPE